MRPPINAKFVLQRDEFVKASGLASRKLPKHIKWAAWVQVGLLCALMLVTVTYRPGGELQSISVIFFVLVWLVLVMGSFARRAMATFQFAPMAGVDIWYEFSDSGFRCGMPNSDSRLDWQAIRDTIETDKLFVLLTHGGLFYAVPKRSLTPEDAGSLHQLLMEKVVPRPA